METPPACNKTLARLVDMALVLAVFALDQCSKGFVISAYRQVPGIFPIEILPFFNIVLVGNTGISFGLFARMQAWMPLFLITVTSLVALALSVWYFRTRDKFVLLALPFIIAGAAGNIADRARFGAVTDFLDFHLGEYHWPAFNIADSAIFIGVVILVLISIVVPDEKS